MKSDRRAFRVDPRLLDFAKKLRSGQAPAEQILWECLRNRRLNGLKFRRQVPIDEYVADFCCAECKVIVETDGRSHYGRLANDEERSGKLIAKGYFVVRYENGDVFDDLEAVLADLAGHCESRRSL